MSKNGSNGRIENMLDDEPIIEAPAKDVDGVPYCVKHHCRMILSSGAAATKGKDYYRCPVNGCEERGIKIRTIKEVIVPKNPVSCPRCSTDEKPVYCEKDKRYSTPMGVVLSCRSCGWKSPMFAVPQLEASRLAAQPKPVIAGVGDR